MKKSSFESLPKTMKVAVATGFGSVEDNIHLREDWPVPTLDDDGINGGKGGSLMLIRVLACALAPGDVRVLSGKTDYMQLPEEGHPYIVGSDVSGIVVKTSPNETKFCPGDYVVSRFDEPKPSGGVAQYRVVRTDLSEKCPTSVPPVVACGLPASAMAAKRIVRQHMKEDDRVLVIGGSGAVGSSVIQYAKMNGARQVVAVSTQAELCRELGADRVVDYRKENWWEIRDFEKDPFDVVFDLVNGHNWEKGGNAGTAIRGNGTYVALLSGVETEIEAHGLFDCVGLVSQLLSRMLWSRLNPFIPTWVAPEALKLEDGDLSELFRDVEEKRLRPLVDPSSPFDFTEKAVRDAFELQKSKHAHGKVVIRIDGDKDNSDT